ncbi:ATP-binding cassette subfamily B protein [Anoxybacillus vitaminiphilus]|uniref:ATP-binding cassette subfamily B protein n=1 Tax=Paranoxybacillus vitaminiphilus TaxID=581036 RepID=A0A327YC21_9BACL|nr:ABC transporter ATP-binding protein [Anoxybacillus vitaminiphilus]RAK18384.1 ATP-binding cassette subfamily B protein [Anoxybacillus vitaminiphilus]
MFGVLSYLKPYTKWMILAWGLMLIELAVELWHPLLMAKIIDDGILQHDFSVVWKWGAVMMGTSLIAFMAGIANSFAAAHVGQNYGFALRNRLFEKVQSFSFANFNQFPTSSLITRMTNDVTQIQNTVFMSLRIMLRAPLLVLFGTVMALYVHFKLALIFVFTVPILLLFLIWMMNKGMALFKMVQQKLDEVNEVMRENLAGMKLIKALMRGEHEQRRFIKANEDLMNRTVQSLQVMELSMPVLLFVMNAGIIVILSFGNMSIQIGSAKAGEVVAIVNYATRITSALSIFTLILIVFSRAKASAQRISEVLAVNSDLSDREEINHKTTVKEGKVVFENVYFQYPNTHAPVLKNISFIAHPGETIAILGATGSGKSSLLQLIPRLYDVNKGRVLLDGIDVRDMNQEMLRKEIGFVPQEVLLFSGTVKENIAFGKEDASMEEIMEAAKHAQIHETIMKLPNGYDTIVGQKGVNLSGGQKQRLSIARALIRKPKILLLDDSTSALDLKTEAELFKALKSYTCTTFIVTQKVSTAMKADTILLLDDGGLLAKGNHECLWKSCALYQKIVQSQLGSEEIYIC